MKYFLGLDNGGTTTKAAIYDREGKEICVASVETKMIVPALWSGIWMKCGKQTAP